MMAPNATRRKVNEGPLVPTYGNFIAGRWLNSDSGRTFSVKNPARGDEIVAQFQDSTERDVETAVSAAQSALPVWASIPAPKRAALLTCAADLCHARLDSIAADLTREEGKPLAEAKAEVTGAIQKLEFLASEAWRLGGDVLPSATHGNAIRTFREPLGVVALITPWNFPFAMPVSKIAAALVAGNTAVLKPSPYAPLSAAHVIEAFESAGIPGGVLNLITDSEGMAGAALVSDQRVRGISFTGSTRVGRHIASAAAATLAKVQLEMGGKNPLVVLEDADLGLALTLAVEGAFGSSGQKCTATGTLILADAIHDRFVDKLKHAASALRVGDGMDASTQIGPLVSERQMKRVIQYIESARTEGAMLVCGGHRLTGDIYDSGFYVAPTVFTGVTAQMTIARDEVFGPVLGVMRARSFDEAIRLANATDYGLSAAICTTSLEHAERFATDVVAGVIKVNEPTTGLATHAPFQGRKHSSASLGGPAVEFFTAVKTLYVRHTA